MSLQQALGLTGRHSRDYQLRLNGRDTIYNIIDLSGFDRDASLKLISDGVLARTTASRGGGGERGFATPTISRDADAFACDGFARRRRRRARRSPATPTVSHDTTSQVDATVIFYLEPETSAGDPDPELYASCSIDTLCSLPSGDDERVVALSARARRAAAAAPPCENYLQAEVAVETAHGWLTTD